ncbi:diguanylate cyclase [Fusibacter tunisiensis]|uniref:Diguanylate cyclase (GGDEF)-like protein n=1 Tax=Fusibacter tunisiensis TaxID=1008308 RepID=A0ABS2MSL7_9FIRM|nr:diguanylate cyclase [Fusibacter tunisiensis]MBM7562395.1 diguanylate cyclase (GGDEF)-like protein [Fusibacter tunisiensis]
MKIINDRYEILEALTKENNWIEYLVKDTKHSTKEAIKRIRIFDTEMSNFDFIQRMETEFIDLKNIEHENLLSLFEFQPIYSINGSRISRKQYFYTYEHFDEKDRISYLDLNKTEVNAVIVQLLRVMRFLHHRGVYYKHLNFDHMVILRNPQGVTLKLVDVANIYVNDYNYKSDFERFNQFMAPEIMWGEEIDATVDIFSLGVVFYYLYYQINYKESNFVEVIKSSSDNNIHQFILKATSHIREERHETIHAFIEVLEKLIWITVDFSDLIYYNRYFEDTEIVGRERIVKDIKILLHEKYMKTLAYNAIYIKGESGIGKTRILREIRQISKYNRYPSLWVQTRHSDPSPFATVRQILKHILELDDASPILYQKYAVELASVLPEYAEALKVDRDRMIDPETQALRILNRVFNFFIEYTSDKFMVLFLDDEQYIKDTESYFYNLLLNHTGMSNYLLIMSGTELQKNQRSRYASIRVIKLPSLTLEETGEIIKHTLGLSQIPYKLTHRIMMENQGKASITKRILYQLWRDGHVYYDVASNKWNLDVFDDKYVFEYYEGRLENFQTLIETLDDTYLDYLSKLSVLKGSFNMNLIFEFCGMEEEEGYRFLSEMEEKRFLNKRISDVEYVFVFQDNEFKKVFYDMLSEDVKQQYYLEAAAYFEKRYMANQEINESLIDYLLLSGKKKYASEYCIIFADLYSKQYNNLKAADLYEWALEIFESNQELDSIRETGLKLIRQLMKIGKIEVAHTISKRMEQYFSDDAPQFEIDLNLEVALIMYYRNEVDTTVKLSKKCIEDSKNIAYIHGEFTGVQTLCKCLTHFVDLDQHLELAQLYLDKSIELGNVYFEAVFHNEMGANYLYRNAFDKSLEAFNKSIECYKQIESEENIIKLYNNIGVVYFEGQGDYLSAREYFRKAHTHALNRNYLVALQIHLNNIGETYVTEGRYEMALRYFEEAHEISEKVGDKKIDILALMNMCGALIKVEKYGKAFTLLNRLEHEFTSFSKSNFDRMDYYILHIEFFMAVNSVMQVDGWKYELSQENIEDDTRKFKLRILDYYLSHRKNQLDLHETSDFPKELEELTEKLVKPSDVVLVRRFLLDVMVDQIINQDYLSAESLYKRDSALIETYNTKRVRVQRDVVAATLSDYSISRIENLLPVIKELSSELLWRVYMILGNEYLGTGNLYHALRYYLMALDEVYDLTQLIPAIYQETYVLYDNTKMALKNKINRITGRLLTFDGIVQNTIYDERFETVEDYFDLSQLTMLYQSEEFLKLAYENTLDQETFLFKDSVELIKTLEKDERANLSAILTYIKQFTLAERGFIYLLDENEKIVETIDTVNGENIYEINHLINLIGNDIEGVFVSKLDTKTNIQLLMEDQKGMMYFPIYEASSDTLNKENRKEDLLLSKQKIVGYVYLDSTNLINRFNLDTFEQAKSFINLIYVFIDNYNLKRVSTVDKLTGVYLRKHLEQQFAIHMSVSRQANLNLSVIMLDIDKFKFVNDTYGHRKGDEILSKLGEILKNSVRSSDYVARYGGEEFIVLLPEADASVGYKVAEKIRTLIESNKLLGEDVPLTVSLGIATYPKDGANEEELIEKADQALYYSKNNGRNQSTSWDEKIIKERHRYDRLTGILTGNISSDTRNVKAVVDVMNQLNHGISRDDSIRNTFISLLDITEGDEIQFILFDEDQKIKEVLYKKKGFDEVQNMLVLSERLINRFKDNVTSSYFIDWEETKSYKYGEETPTWKSYIVLSMKEFGHSGILSIAVDIAEKEFDFSNYNFVDALRPVLEHIFLDRVDERELNDIK